MVTLASVPDKAFLLVLVALNYLFACYSLLIPAPRGL